MAKKSKCATACVAAKPAATAKKRITFEITAGPGHKVSIAGSFNDWDPAVKFLAEKSNTGVYSGCIMLAPGSYEYKFVVDGDWRLDENNPNFSANDFGTLNSVLIVE